MPTPTPTPTPTPGELTSSSALTSAGGSAASQDTITCSYNLCGCSCDAVSPSGLTCITESQVQSFIDSQGGCESFKDSIGGSCADAGPFIVGSQRQLGYTTISATCSDSADGGTGPIAVYAGAAGGIVALLLIIGLGVHFSGKKKPAPSGPGAPTAAPAEGVQITGGAADPAAVGVEAGAAAAASKPTAADVQITGGVAAPAAVSVQAVDRGDGHEGWGPFGFLFPKSWVFVWCGYAAMLVFTIVILPMIGDALSVMPSMNHPILEQVEAIEAVLSIGPCVHCILMPLLWAHKHREVKKWMEKRASDASQASEPRQLDPEAKTVIFARKLKCTEKVMVVLADLTIGLVGLLLRIIKNVTLGTVDLSAFWFPMPFYHFWKAKMDIRAIQIDGALICTTASQGDAYMKFCTEAMLNFWTLGLYGLCCTKRTNYGRWLDRHLRWQGETPPGYNNQFRLFDEKFSFCQRVQVHALGLLLGGILTKIPLVGSIWPFGLLLPWYVYTIKLRNMKFGGSDPTFTAEFTCGNYIYKYYTLGVCGLCGGKVKRWVDACIVMGEPKFDQEMADQDAQADAANPNELNLHYANQSFPPASSAKPSADVQSTGGATVAEVPNVTVQVPTEETYTFNKATAETVCGITAKKSGDEVSIASLNAHGAAAGCGLEAGDVLLKINGFLVKTPEQATTLFKSAEGEVKVQVTRLVRQQSSIPVQVPTEHTCTFNKATAETICGINMQKSGTDGKDTVVASLNPAGAAASCGLAVGDTLLSINGMRVTSPDQAATLLKSVEGEVTVCTARLVRQQSMVSDKI